MFSIQRLAVLGCMLFAVLMLISMSPGLRNSRTWGEASKTYGIGVLSSSSSSSTPSGFHSLFESTKQDITAKEYIDAAGRVFAAHKDGPWWSEPLGKDVLIVDIDTRIPNGPNQLMNDTRMDWESIAEHNSGGMISASYMNHFLYAQIHGYQYQILTAQDMGDRYNTWTRPHLLLELTKSHKFVVALDADATIQHLEVPLEWLFNRWGITSNTSIAMPIDTAEIHGGNPNVSKDSKGKIVQNAGFIIAQSSPYTTEMLQAWTDCPNEKQYPGCAQWLNKWSHEQRVFSEYIRYDYNKDGNNIVEIPCDDGMGYPGIENHDNILTPCLGLFVRHHTLDKGMTKTSTSGAVMQVVTDLLQTEFLSNKEKYWVREANMSMSDGR